MLLQPAGALTAGISFSGSWCHNSSLLENWKIFVHWFVNWSYFNCRHKMLGIKFLWGVETICHLCQHCALTYCKDSHEKWHQRPKSLVACLTELMIQWNSGSQPIFLCVMLTASRLLHYFRGHHHLEEIMYNENMRRSQLKTLFDKFRSVLVVTNHEDPIISIFQSPME